MNLRRRISLAAAVLVVTTGTLVGLLTIHELRKALEAEDITWSASIAQAVAKAVTTATLTRDKLVVRDVLRRVQASNDELVYLLVVDFKGKVFASSFRGALPAQLNGDHSNCAQGHVSHLVIGGREIRDINFPLIQGLNAHLHIGISEARVAHDLNASTTGIVWGILVVTVLGAFGALLLGKRVSQPIVELTRALKSYGRGENPGELERIKTGIRETGELLESFRNMVQERSKAEANLRDSEAYNRMLFDTSPIGLALCRMDGSLVDINQAYADILGRSIEETIPLSYWDITPKEYAEQEQLQLESLQKHGHYGPYEKEYLRKDGSRVPVLLRGYLLERNHERYIWSSVEDITERKKAEDSLRHLNEELERRVHERTAKIEEQAAILDQIHDAILVADLQGTITGWNKGAERLTGYRAEEAIGRNIDFLCLNDNTRFKEQTIAPLVEKGEHELDRQLLCKDGSHTDVHLSLTRLDDAQGKPVKMVGYMLDITERKQTEQRIKDAMNLAERANRAKSEFLSRMSHELRTPMNAILGFSQLLEQNFEGNLSQLELEYVTEVLKGGHHLLDLINEILDLSRIESGKMQISLEDVDVNELVGECVSLMRPMANGRSITLQCSEGNEAIPVIADRMRLKQVILNFLSNAVKYNRDGGKVDIDYGNEGEYVRLSIRDTGPGIPESMRSRVFEPFDRLTADMSNVEGTGIGLALAKHLTEFMGGRIGFESTEGEGSCFWIELPSGSGHALYDVENIPVAQHTVSSEHKVLYVEDNPMNLRLIERLMEQHEGIQLYDARDIGSAMALVHQQQFDLILLDIQLSAGESGYEILNRLRQESELRKIPVVAVSANATAGDIEHGLAAGFQEYITKPINVEAFNKMLERFLIDKAE